MGLALSRLFDRYVDLAAVPSTVSAGAGRRVVPRPALHFSRESRRGMGPGCSLLDTPPLVSLVALRVRPPARDQGSSFPVTASFRNAADGRDLLADVARHRSAMAALAAVQARVAASFAQPVHASILTDVPLTRPG